MLKEDGLVLWMEDRLALKREDGLVLWMEDRLMLKR